MPVITPDPVSGVYNQWKVTANDYKINVVNTINGAVETKQVDFQDLLTMVNLKRASAVEKEVAALTVKVRKRNSLLETVSALIAFLGEKAAKYNPEKTNPTTEYTALEENGAIYNGLMAIADTTSTRTVTIFSSKFFYMTITIGNFSKEFSVSKAGYSSSGGTISKSEYELLNQTAKAKIDSLNSDSQMDMNKLQSLVNKRDESYTTATTLMTNVADVRSTLIKNL